MTHTGVYRGIVTPEFGEAPYWSDAMRDELRDAYQRATLSESDYLLALAIHEKNVNYTMCENRKSLDEHDDVKLFKTKMTELKSMRAKEESPIAQEMECDLTSIFRSLALKREAPVAPVAPCAPVAPGAPEQQMRNDIAKARKYMDEAFYLCEEQPAALYCYATAAATWASAQQKLLEKTTLRGAENLKARCTTAVQRRFGDGVKLLNTSPLGMPTYSLRVQSGKRWRSSTPATLEQWLARLEKNDATLDEEVRRLRR